MTFNAYRLFDTDDRPQGRLVDMEIDDLSPGNVVIRTAYASVNYKDALAAHGLNKLIREYPRIGGIDLTGTVAESQDPRFKEGDPVIVHGFGIGIDHDGGYAEYSRVPGDWVLPLPAGLTLREAAVIGVAGYTAALSINLMELNGLRPDAGKVLITGATGGVASIAIDILAQLGYTIVAITGKTDSHDYLRELGASDILDRSVVTGTRPLEKAQWAGAIDSVGGDTLAWLTRTVQPQGVIAAFGNAAGPQLNTTVLPFILRGIRLIGVNAGSPMALRQEIWSRLGGDMKPRHLQRIAQQIQLSDLPTAFQRLLDSQGRGRYLVALS